MLKSCFNSDISKTFKIEKVLSKGAPLAPYLFIFIGKCLTIWSSKENNLETSKGFLCHEDETHQIISQYVDNITIMIKGEEANHC
jgi:hypothetical protein